MAEIQEADVIVTLRTLLLNIREVLDPIEARLIYDSLPVAEKSNYEMMSEIFCNANGNFVENTGKCDCDIAYFGYRCTIPGKFYWGEGWTALIALLSIFFVILALLTWYYFYQYLKEEYGSFGKKFRRVLNTPKYLVVLNMIIISTSKSINNHRSTARIIYVTVDLLKQNGIFSRITDRILHELIFSACICIFFILLLVWMGLYTAFDIENKRGEYRMRRKKLGNYNDIIPDDQEILSNPIYLGGCCRHYYIFKQMIIVTLFFVYPIQITFSYFRGRRSVDSDALNIALSCLMGLIVIFLILFIYYTCRLKCTLSASYEAPQKNLSKIFLRKSHNKTIKNGNKRVRPKEVKQFLKEVEEKSVLNLVVRYIIDPDNKENEGEDSDSELDYEDEMREINLNVFERDEDDANSRVNIIKGGGDLEEDNEEEDGIRNKRFSRSADNNNIIIPDAGNSNVPNYEDDPYLFHQSSANIDSKEQPVKIKDNNNEYSSTSNINVKVRGKDYKVIELSSKTNRFPNTNRNLNRQQSEFKDSNTILANKSTPIHNTPSLNRSESNINNNNPNALRRAQTKDKFEYQKKEYTLTKNDMSILNKIFGISYLIICVAIVLVIVGMLIRSTRVLTTPAGAIAVITISFIFEIIAFIAIFYLFVKEIENKEYDNLKIIGDIENYLKNNQERKSKLKFDELTRTEIYDRMRNFMNIEFHEQIHYGI